MKTKADLVEGWLKKANSDLTNASLCLKEGKALDTVCFHSQQAAEKAIKAYLTAKEINFPFIHNLEKLLEFCIPKEPSFADIKSIACRLTPFAVELRYDDDFWPTKSVAQKAFRDAKKVYAFICKHLPPNVLS
jgi:HEPN domain-containing protein